jgi:hypothetical protein
MFSAFSTLSASKEVISSLTYMAPITNYTNTISRGEIGIMADRLRGERLQIMLSPEELALIDDFRFAKRMPSRAATVRELFRRGLAAEGFLIAPMGQRSKDFGVDAKAARLRR